MQGKSSCGPPTPNPLTVLGQLAVFLNIQSPITSQITVHLLEFLYSSEPFFAPSGVTPSSALSREEFSAGMSVRGKISTMIRLQGVEYTQLLFNRLNLQRISFLT